MTIGVADAVEGHAAVGTVVEDEDVAEVVADPTTTITTITAVLNVASPVISHANVAKMEAEGAVLNEAAEVAEEAATDTITDTASTFVAAVAAEAVIATDTVTITAAEAAVVVAVAVARHSAV